MLLTHLATIGLSANVGGRFVVLPVAVEFVVGGRLGTVGVVVLLAGLKTLVVASFAVAVASVILDGVVLGPDCEAVLAASTSHCILSIGWDLSRCS